MCPDPKHAPLSQYLVYCVQASRAEGQAQAVGKHHFSALESLSAWQAELQGAEARGRQQGADAQALSEQLRKEVGKGCFMF